MANSHEFSIDVDAPNYILIDTDLPKPLIEHLDGELHEGKTVRIPFTKYHALRIREYLTGRSFKIGNQAKSTLKALADTPDDEIGNLIWSTSLLELRENKFAGKFVKIKTEWDLLHYLPLRYIDRTNPQSISDLKVGDWATIIGTVAKNPEYKPKHDLVEITVEDHKGYRISAAFFNQVWLSRIYRQGDKVILYGNYSEYVRANRSGGRPVKFPQISSPKIDKQSTLRGGALTMIPVYPQKKQDKSLQLQRAQSELLQRIIWIEDPIPEPARRKYDLMHRNEAYREIHFPTSKESLEAAQRRIAFDEFIRLQIFLEKRRKENLEENWSHIKEATAWKDKFIEALPFQLTDGQLEVIQEICDDMKLRKPMYRLLQGDVGSGKAQPLYSKILTPSGWITMGSIKTGDEVIAPDGSISKVSAIFPQGKRPIYELLFEDGSTVQADEEHLWLVYANSSKKSILLRTREILSTLKTENGKHSWRVPYPQVEGGTKRNEDFSNPELFNSIISIRYVGEQEAQCIKLDNPDGLYITDNYTVTHNTEISTAAALVAAEEGYQVALLAPTDTLAQQLYDRYVKVIKDAGIEELDDRIILLKGSYTPKKKRETTEKINNGEALIVIGTHSIVQKTVEFNNLGLAVVDEQHKFGVEQRDALRKKQQDGSTPDFLSMSATPIPRATSQIVYGDMDISIVKELPAGRIPIRTFWSLDPKIAWDKVREEVESGHQAYVVTSLVEESEKIENVESAVETYLHLGNNVFPDLRLGLLHGKLKAAEKTAVLEAYKNGTIDILVATSVVEVGINVPNSTVMTILDANRFGIASLHQIRGRVGRSTLPSYCYLIGDPKYPDAEERLNALVESTDGFWLAEKDLEIRGEGTLFSQVQSGDNDMNLANLREYKDQLELAKTVLPMAYSSKGLQAEVESLYKDKIIKA